MIDDVLSALAAAWRVSLIASVLLFAALAVAPYWSATIYREALEEALSSDPM